VSSGKQLKAASGPSFTAEFCVSLDISRSSCSDLVKSEFFKSRLRPKQSEN